MGRHASDGGLAPEGRKAPEAYQADDGRRAGDARTDDARQAAGPRGATGRRAVAEDEVPSWAALGPDGNPPRQSHGGLSAEQRRKRRMIMAGAGVVVLAAAVGGYLQLVKPGSTANVASGDLITTFLPGEVQQVPNACTTPSSATLLNYLPGKPKVVAPPLNGGLESQCSWTLDAAPVYRVVELDVHAYSPSGLASGDGSATFAAIDAIAEAEQAKQTPGKNSGIPAATVTPLSGLGDSGFIATQVFHNGATVTDLVTEVVRYRNVLVTVVVNGLDQTGPKKYGPVSMSDLTAAAQAVAQGATAKVRAIH